MSTILDQETQQYLSESVLCWLATANQDGQPSVSPKEIFSVFDATHIVVAHIASPQSIKNISQQPKVCLSVVDIFKQRGRQIYGIASILLPNHEHFDAHAAPLIALAGHDYPIKAVIKISVTNVKSIIAPSYWLFPEVSEKQKIGDAKKQYLT